MIVLPTPLQRLHEDESGQTAIAIVIVFVGVFAFAALALDAGVWFFDHRTAQNQVEAAAHAGAQEMPDEAAAMSKAQAWLNQNGVDLTLVESAHCEGLAAGEARIVFPGGDRVRVCVRRESLVLLSALTLVDTVRVSATATARLFIIPSPYSLMAMYPGTEDCDEQRTLWATGSGAGVVVTGGGGTYTDSACCPNALETTGGGVIEAEDGQHDVVGCGAGSGVTPDPNENAENLDDPFEDLDPPAVSGSCVTRDSLGRNIPNTINGGTWELLPGRYCDGLKASSSPTIRLRSGVYIFQDDLELGSSVNFTSDLNNNGVLESTEEVLLYATCDPSPCGSEPCDPLGSEAPRLQFPGQAQLWLRGHTDYEQILIWVDRTSSYFSTISLSGGATGRLDGRLYALCSFVDFTGSSSGSLTVNMSLVAATFKFAGNGLVSIPYDPILAPPIKEFAIVE